MSVQRASRNESRKIMNALIGKKRRCSDPLQLELGVGSEPNSGINLYKNDIDNDDIDNDSEVSFTQLTPSYPYPSNLDLTKVMYEHILKLNTNVEVLTKNIEVLNKNVKVLLIENKDLKERLIKLGADNQKVQTRLLTEVIAQRKIIQGNKPRLLIPPKPFNKIEEINKFEDDLKDSAELCEQLESEMLQYNISDPAKFVRTIWRKIFIDEVATNYSWKGTNTKKCVLSMTITTALRNAFNKKFSVDEKRFALICSKWFQTSNDRIKYYNKTNKVNF